MTKIGPPIDEMGTDEGRRRWRPRSGPKKPVLDLPPLRMPPSVLTWNDGVVVKLAKAARRRRRNADLLILADALEEAGWNEQTWLASIRTSPYQARWWLLNLILGTWPKRRRS